MENTSSGTENLTHKTIVSGETIGSLKFFLICTSLVTIIVGLIGNGIVIFLTGCRMKTTVNSIWFFNLAIADLIFILSSIIYSFSGLGRWRSHILAIVLRLNQLASTFFLVVISLDRCLCTWKVVWAQNNRTLFRARIICVIVWVSSIGCSLPYVINPVYTMSLVTYDFTLGFLIPFLIIASSYIAIAVRIKRLKLRKQLRSYRLIITVILSFFICCFPFYICKFFKVSSAKYKQGDSNENNILNKAYTFSIYLVHLNSCLNPFVYVFMCDDYKKKLKQSLLLVLETVFAEDPMNVKEDRKQQRGQENQTRTVKNVENRFRNVCDHHGDSTTIETVSGVGSGDVC